MRNICIAAGSLVALALAAPGVVSADTTFYWNVHNRTDNDLIKWSKDFSLPANRWPTDFSVRRWDPTGRKWDDETKQWKWRRNSPKSGQWHVNIEANTAPPVPKSTWLKFDVKFNTDDVGIKGGDRKYKPDPCPKQALKKSVDATPTYNADIDSAVYYGGQNGQDIPGLDLFVPASTYAYLYQVNSLQGSSVLSMRLSAIPGMFDSFSEISYSHDADLNWDYRSDEFGEPGTGAQEVSIAMFEYLGSPGVSSLSWGPDGDDFVASWAGISAGQSSNILLGLSTLPPGMPHDRFNAYLSDGVNVAENYVWTPIPAPGASLLGVIGLACIMALRRRLSLVN